MGETDHEAVGRLRRGDGSAFEELFQRYYSQVYRVLYGLVGSREQAEDLAQETFLTLYGQPPRLDADGSLLAWLCRVALNRGYNALRGDRRERQRYQRGAELPEQHDPYAEALRAEERAQVRVALARLPERQARLLLLRHAGLSYAEIATALDLAPGSVGTLLNRAERAFLQCYTAINQAEQTGLLDTERA